MKRLILLRHGRTAWNADGRGQGHADIALDDLGHLQAKAAAPVLAGYRPTALWSSDLARAADTAAYVAEATGLSVRLDPRLREYDLGDRTGLTMPEFAERYPEEYADFRAGRFGGISGGESVEEALARLAPVLEEITRTLGPDDTGVVVTHGGVLKVALRHLLGWPDGVQRTLVGLDNCGWAVLLADPRDPVGDHGWRLSAYNRTALDPDFASGPGVG